MAESQKMKKVCYTALTLLRAGTLTGPAASVFESDGCGETLGSVPSPPSQPPFPKRRLIMHIPRDLRRMRICVVGKITGASPRRPSRRRLASLPAGKISPNRHSVDTAEMRLDMDVASPPYTDPLADPVARALWGVCRVRAMEGNWDIASTMPLRLDPLEGRPPSKAPQAPQPTVVRPLSPPLSPASVIVGLREVYVRIRNKPRSDPGVGPPPCVRSIPHRPNAHLLRICPSWGGYVFIVKIRTRPRSRGECRLDKSEEISAALGGAIKCPEVH